jgi:membrane protease YdiL (CAAX protease family)
MDELPEAPESPEPPESAAAVDRLLVVRLAVLVEGGLLVLASLLGWWLEQPPLERFHWDFRAVLEGAVATLPLLLLFLVIVRWPVGPLGRIHRFGEQVIRPLLAPCSVLDLFGISALAGLGEEVLFRGVLQGAFAARAGVIIGLILASVLFGLLHAITLTYVVLATLMGAYLGGLWWYSDNLLAPIVTHALYDFLVLLWLLRGPGSHTPPSAEPDAPPEEPSPPEG